MDFVRLHQGELYSSVEPVSPVVLKSLILRHMTFDLLAAAIALEKNFFAFVDFCKDQNSRERLSASVRSLNPGISFGWISKGTNSILVGCPFFKLASIEFWQISRAKDFIGVQLKVSTPESAMPKI